MIEKFLPEESYLTGDQLAYLESSPLFSPPKDAKPSEKVVAAVGSTLNIQDILMHYRRYGHRYAHLDPLELQQVETPFWSAEWEEHPILYDWYGTELQSVDQLKYRLEQVYAGSLALECEHLDNEEEKKWLYRCFETRTTEFSAEKSMLLLQTLLKAEEFELFCHQKFVAQKRFSLEGTEALIAILSEWIEMAELHAFQEVVIGMSHRGRLNTMLNVLKRPPELVWREFDPQYDEEGFTGDVKYHQGYEAQFKNIGVKLMSNPSHLESVMPVVMGYSRAKQSLKRATLPILVHGDGAFSGQGVVMESFSLSQTRYSDIGGALHLVVNNQIAFTTSEALDIRSSPYCTDIAKMTQVPVFHVNADDPQAVIWAAKTAFDYRQRFHKDCIIDLVGYRKRGHNEADDPFLTQPQMYQKISEHPSVVQQYSLELEKHYPGTLNQLASWRQAYRTFLTQKSAPSTEPLPLPAVKSLSAPLVLPAMHSNGLRDIAQKIFILPTDFSPLDTVKKVYADRLAMTSSEKPMDWGCAELLALASILDAGGHLRLVGQDSARGTFSQRHAVVHDKRTAQPYCPLRQVAGVSNLCEIVDSILAEEAVLSFEYGWSIAQLPGLSIWEAQFGDFVNGAQVLIDQYLSSAQQKWRQTSGLVLLLPHGYEGMGPEHSSARLERFLQLSAQNNWSVVMPSTPAQYFHVLRRQAELSVQKPLIIFTPKSLLRRAASFSTTDALSDGGFSAVLPDRSIVDPSRVERVIFCAGKLYYDLCDKRLLWNLQSVAIERIEELYPLPVEGIWQRLECYPNMKVCVWAQEEPANQGAWSYLLMNLWSQLSNRVSFTLSSRPACAAPAAGHRARHEREHEQLLADALGYQGVH